MILQLNFSELPEKIIEKNGLLQVFYCNECPFVKNIYVEEIPEKIFASNIHDNVSRVTTSNPVHAVIVDWEEIIDYPDNSELPGELKKAIFAYEKSREDTESKSALYEENDVELDKDEYPTM